jgi:hypothetical protein
MADPALPLPVCEAIPVADCNESHRRECVALRLRYSQIYNRIQGLYMYTDILILAQTSRPAHASWVEPFIIGLVVGMLIILVGRKFYRRM